MSTGSRVIAPSWLRGRKIEEGLLEVATDKTQVSIVGPLSAEQVAAPGSLGASPSLFIGSFAKLNRRSTGPSARAGAVRNRPLRLRQHWRDLIGAANSKSQDKAGAKTKTSVGCLLPPGGKDCVAEDSNAAA